jgi:sorting nexin-1/2
MIISFFFLHILTVGQAERRALDAKHEFDQCSKLIKSEMARFEQERVDDFKISLQSFLDGMITRQKEVCAAAI